MLLFTRLRRRCVSFSNCIAQVLAVTRLRAHRTHLQHQAQERQEVRTLISATPVDLTVLAGAWSLPQNAAQTTSTADEGDPSELHLNRLSITGQNPTVTEDLSDSDQILTYFTINCDGDLAVDKSASVDVTHLLARTSFSDDVTDPLAAITATANSYPSVDCNGTTLTFHNLGTDSSSASGFAGKAGTIGYRDRLRQNAAGAAFRSSRLLQQVRPRFNGGHSLFSPPAEQIWAGPTDEIPAQQHRPASQRVSSCCLNGRPAFKWTE